MHSNESVTLTRDVEASVVPVGTKVTLLKGETAHITQSLGGAYTVVVNGNMFRLDGKDADALGLQIEQKTSTTGHQPRTLEEVEKESWVQMKTCYDPEIPVNIVDLGLIYDCHVTPLPAAADRFQVDVKMTLTAPGCGMGPEIKIDAVYTEWGCLGIGVEPQQVFNTGNRSGSGIWGLPVGEGVGQVQHHGSPRHVGWHDP